MKFPLRSVAVEDHAEQVLSCRGAHLLDKFVEQLFFSHVAFSLKSTKAPAAPRRSAAKSAKTTPSPAKSATPPASTAVPASPPRATVEQQPPEQYLSKRSGENNDRENDNRHNPARRNAGSSYIPARRRWPHSRQLDSRILRDDICNPMSYQRHRAAVVSLSQQRYGFS